jgi:micrococcal nuclease
VCWNKYRGNYDRPLGFVYLDDGTDFQEHMIRKGYSPYFVKYGYAVFPENHQRYVRAEREAQIQNIGVWNQIAVNGSEMRNYALLSAWWHMRAAKIEIYRRYKQGLTNPPVFDPRFDYEQLVPMAESEETATIFTEVRDLRRVGGRHGLIKVGSEDRPFSIFIPEIDEPAGQEIWNLLANRYLSGDGLHPRLSYVYITGETKMYRGTPEIVLTDVSQLSDSP